MHLEHEALVRAPIDAIFAVAANVEHWPQLHPAYRWCRVIDRQPRRLMFEMAGRIRGWPARWTAEQKQFPAEGRIEFRHLHGITTGMIVVWRFQPEPAGVRVRLTHDLVLRWPLIGRVASDLVIGPVFIDWIASQTLQSVRHEVERS